MNSRFWIGLLLRVVLGVAFVWAAASKLRDPLAFATAVESYQVVGADWARWVALGLPWLELWAGLGLFCLLYTSPSPRDRQKSRMPSSA